MTSKKAFAVWILIVFAFLSLLGSLHAWLSWQFEGVAFVTIFSFVIDVTTYFIVTIMITFALIGGACFIVFRGESMDLPLYQLSKDLEQKLDAKGEELKSFTEEALTKLGLREFQLKEGVKGFQKKLGEIETKVKEGVESHEKILDGAQKKLVELERKIDRIQDAQKELPVLKKKLQAIDGFEKDLKNIQETVKSIDSIPKPSLASVEDIGVLEGKVLKSGTVRQLKESGIGKVEDLLLRSPVEIALTKTMTEDEAKSLQSVIQLLMIPGIGHDDAVLLLKSGVNSKQELSLQDTLSLGSRLAKTAELYIKEGKIKESEKPTLEDIASWIRLAKTQ